MSNESSIYDVLIVGAGPAGALSANLLGKYGVKVLLVDKEDDIVKTPRAVGLCNEGSRIINAAGLMDSFEPTLLDAAQVQFRCASLEPFFSFDCAEEVNGFPILRTLYQPALEQCMRDGLDRYDNVDFWKSTECLQIEDRGNEVLCRVVTNGDEYRTISCRYVLGCDGGRSNIRKMMNVGFTGHTYAQDWLILDVENDPSVHTHNQHKEGKTNDRDLVYFMCDPNRPGVTLPTPNNTRRWEFVVKNDESNEYISSDAAVKELLKPWGDVSEMNVIRKTIYTFHARIAKKFRVGNVFLLGDAAHLTPPFAGQGLMAGLRDSYNISWKLAQVLKGTLSDRVLDTYHSERRPQAVIIVNTARAMGMLVLPQSKWFSKVRNVVFRTLNRISGRSDVASIKKTPNSILGMRSLMLGLGDVSELTVGYEFLQSIVETRFIAKTGGVDKQSSLIDDCLSGNFAVISYEKSAQSNLSNDTKSRLSEIDSEYCVIKGGHDLSRVEEISRKTGETVVWDVDGYYRDKFDSGKKCVLIRPDKMIVVCESPERFDSAVGKYLSSLEVGQKIKLSLA